MCRVDVGIIILKEIFDGSPGARQEVSPKVLAILTQTTGSLPKDNSRNHCIFLCTLRSTMRQVSGGPCPTLSNTAEEILVLLQRRYSLPAFTEHVMWSTNPPSAFINVANPVTFSSGRSGPSFGRSSSENLPRCCDVDLGFLQLYLIFDPAQLYFFVGRRLRR